MKHITNRSYYLAASCNSNSAHTYNQLYFMRLNNIAFFLLCLLIIPVSAQANDPMSNVCAKFRANVENSEANTAQKPDIPFRTGLLWKAEKDGKVNYVFGTIHSQDYAVTKFPPQVRLALVKSKTLLMETIPNNANNQAFLDNMYFNDGTRLDNFLELELLEELKFQIQEYGFDSVKASQIKPWAAFSIIGRPKPVRAPTQEMNLMQIGLQSGLEVKELESMEEIVTSLDDLSMSDQIIILKDTICNHDKIIHDTKKLIDLYVARDLAGIVEFNNQPHYDEAVFERFMHQILYKRNEKVMRIIETEFAKGNAFVAIGASHLADEKGLLNELQNKGYKLTAIY